MIFHGLGCAAAPVQLEAAQQALNTRLSLWAGRPGTLLCRAPLRTRACPFPSTRLKQALLARRRAEVPGDCGCGRRRV